jgi:lysophospholipase L1-like esterase
MKRMGTMISIFIFMLFGCGNGNNQLPLQTSCREYGNTQGTVLLMGDSNTWHMPKDILPGDYVNCGQIGWRVLDVYSNMQYFIDEYHPKTIVVMIGTNDIREKEYDSSDGAYPFGVFSKMANIAGSNNASIYLRSIPPTSGDFAWMDYTTQVFDDGLQQYCAGEGIPYVNNRPAWEDSTGYFAADMTADGLHLSAKGYDVIRSNFYQ